MSWLSSIGSALGKVAKGAVGVVKKVATPLASFAVGLVPGVGPLLSQGVDIIGNKLLGDNDDANSDAGQSATPVLDAMAQINGMATGLGSSPAAQALANATTASSFLGIGGSAPGVFGIGDGKPGVFGIGTGKAKAAASAEQAAASAGASPAQAKAAGQAAAAKVNDDGTPNSSLNPLLVAGAALLALLAL
jgi:hypothetical protein